mmetsp:Transcript_10237/g.13720  ORF Transcript_10237/g.13720 Transcript_10237/m.13720 type:complete len:431 (+) Transcript_10237:53-1345(+)
MKFSPVAFLASLLVAPTYGFAPSTPSSWSTITAKQSSLFSTPPPSGGMDEERMKQIIAEESSDASNLAASAAAMKNMTPADIEKMMGELDSMPDFQKKALKSMGMDPTLMKKSLEMMKTNPGMMKSAQKMMENMTPEQLMAQSKMAQENMAQMTPEQVEMATSAMESLSTEQLDAAADIIKERGLPGSAGDPLVIENMFRTGELMSKPPAGGVTFAAFASLPPITLLSGTREEDLSEAELKECWADGSLGATRVDRQGFERVWNEVREYFEGDVMDEARKTAAKKRGQKKVRSDDDDDVVAVPAAAVAPTPAATTPMVGAAMSPEEMRIANERVKEMSEDDIGAMLDQMSSMTPEQEARMKAMGMDPSMMSKAASMMASNPMMKAAAAKMMKNMTPEQMQAASQQAQNQMKGMGAEDYERMMEQMKKEVK